MNQRANHPPFMEDSATRKILLEVIAAIPNKTEIYLCGGTIRNALYYSFFNEKLKQADFDLILIGNEQQFIEKLLSVGFDFGNTRRTDKVVMKKAKVSQPKDFYDYVYLDIVISQDSIESNLSHRVDFTVNGFAISLNELGTKDWTKKIIHLPTSLIDLQSKKLRVNTYHPNTIFAYLRLLAKGFLPCSKKEIEKMVESAHKIRKSTYEKMLVKLEDTFGSIDKAKLFTKKSGVSEEIFSLKPLQD